jgi:outer membrane protein assembly factor BamA
VPIRPFFVHFLFAISSFILSFASPNNVLAQDTLPRKPAPPTILHIRKVAISGNGATKLYIVTREMSMKAGDTVHLANLANRLRRDEQLLMNLSLFNSAKFNVTNWQNDSLDVTVALDEALALYPVPFAELADRNPYVWWNQYHHSLNRINFILKVIHFNLTGNADRLSVLAQAGYSQKLQLSYRTPYLDKKQTIRANIGTFYSRQREVQADTRDSKQFFVRTDNSYPLERWRASADLTYRKGYNIEQGIGVTYYNNKIADTVLRLNPQFFSGQRQQQYISLGYWFKHDTRDIRPYPAHGHVFNLWTGYDGFGSIGAPNRWSAEAEIWQYFAIGKKTSVETALQVHKTLWATQIPYYNRVGLGYGDYIRGYDSYVQDGQDWVFAKAAVRTNLIDYMYDFGTVMPIKSIRYMPVRVYATWSVDGAYVRDAAPTFNPLANRIIYGGGPGIDVRLYFENTFSIEYLVNHKGERDLFVRFKVAFN